MREDLRGMASSCFNRSLWAEALFQFAQTSGLVISLYDPAGQRICGPCFNHGWPARLAREGIWDAGSWGIQTEQTLVQRCADQRVPMYEDLFGCLGLLALPIIKRDAVRLVCVLGWVPSHALEARTILDLGEQLRLSWDEIWPLLRGQPPVSEERLRRHGQLLECFSSRLLQQLDDSSQRSRHEKEGVILQDLAFALAGADSEAEICQIAHGVLREILSDACCVIHLREPGDAGTADVMHANDDRTILPLMTRVASVRRHIRLPIPSQREEQLGHIDLTFEWGRPIEACLGMLQGFVAQLGIALQKTRVRHRLAGQRPCQTLSRDLKMPLHTIMNGSQGSGLDARLMEDLLDTSRILSGRIRLERRVCDAAEILQRTLDALGPTMQMRGQWLAGQIAAQPLYFYGDGVRLHRVFWNLLSNASQFTEDGGLIAVSLHADERSIQLDVKDFGRSMTAGQLKQLQDSLKREAAACGGAEGSGPGLAIVRHLLVMHGGSVTVSVGEGKGASFRVLLPRMGAEHEPTRVRRGIHVPKRLL